MQGVRKWCHTANIGLLRKEYDEKVSDRAVWGIGVSGECMGGFLSKGIPDRVKYRSQDTASGIRKSGNQEKSA